MSLSWRFCTIAEEHENVGWQRERRHNFAQMTSGVPCEEDLVNDGWTSIVRLVMARREAAKSASPEQMQQMLQIADFHKMNSIRARVDHIVKNKKTAEALKP